MFKKLLIGMLVIGLTLGLMSSLAIGKTKVVYWSTEPPTLPEDVEHTLQFEVLNPDIDVIRQYIPAGNASEKMMIAIASGNTPDVITDYLGRVSAYWDQDALESLNGTLSEEELNDYIPGLLDFCSINGNLIGYPVPYAGRLWAVNSVIAERAGVLNLIPQGENLEWGFDTFMVATRKINELEGIYPIGFFASGASGDYYTLIFFQMFGATLYEKGDHTKTTLNSNAGVEALEWMIQMVEEGLAPLGPAGMCDDDFVAMRAAGKIAFGGWPFTQKQAQEHYDNGLIDYVAKDIFIEPPHKMGTPAPPLFIGPPMFSVCKNASDKDAAIAFALYMTNAENTQKIADTYSRIGTRKSTKTSSLKARVGQNIAMKNGIGDLGLTSPYYLEVRDLLYPQLQAAFMGQKTAKQALDDFAQAVSELWK